MLNSEKHKKIGMERCSQFSIYNFLSSICVYPCVGVRGMEKGEGDSQKDQINM